MERVSQSKKLSECDSLPSDLVPAVGGGEGRGLPRDLSTTCTLRIPGSLELFVNFPVGRGDLRNTLFFFP